MKSRILKIRTQFLYDGQWEQAEVRDETISVKGGEAVPFEVVVTRHGPIISDILYKEEDPGAGCFLCNGQRLEPTKELEAILNMNKATDWEGF